MGEVSWTCGDGNTIHLGLDPHVPWLNPTYHKLEDRKITSLLYEHKLGWNRNKIKTIFPPDDIAAIKLPAPAPGGRGDTLLWNKSWTRNFNYESCGQLSLKNPNPCIKLRIIRNSGGNLQLNRSSFFLGGNYLGIPFLLEAISERDASHLPPPALFAKVMKPTHTSWSIAHSAEARSIIS